MTMTMSPNDTLKLLSEASTKDAEDSTMRDGFVRRQNKTPSEPEMIAAGYAAGYGLTYEEKKKKLQVKVQDSVLS